MFTVQPESYNVVGLMSGTSLDGLDICLTNYTSDKTTNRWRYQVIKAQTIAYSPATIGVLRRMPTASLAEYLQLNIEYSQTISAMVLQFLKDMSIKVDFISSHGHTILHQPHNRVSLQCCDPTYLAAATGIDCIGNFRQLDVYRGGQGAPLVPYGSELFPNYSVFLNFGGIVNIDCSGVGWDIGFGNLLSNHYATLLGLEFDREGGIGKSGKLSLKVEEVFKSNQKLSQVVVGKSFGREDFEVLLQKLAGVDVPAQDILFTHYQFLSNLIIEHIESIVRPKFFLKGQLKVLCTGGGVYNSYLMGLLKNNTQHIEFVVPDQRTIEFKEAIVFGFLGVKFVRNQQNCSRGVGGTYSRGTTLLTH